VIATLVGKLPMGETSQHSTCSAHGRDGGWAWAQLLTLSALLVLLYGRVVLALAVDWWTDSNASHGLIVPFVCAWIIWRQRDRIASARVEPNWWGIAIILAGVAVFLAGVFGAEVFLSRVSLLILLAGLAVQLRGWPFFRTLLFPWALLFLTIPLPAIILNEIAFPLQLLASRLASSLLEFFGVPVLLLGNVIQLPSITLDVVEACSGLRSLVSLITLAVIYGYLFESSMWRRCLLVAIAIPVAVLANGVRIMGSGLLGQYWDPQKAEGFFHLFSGWLVFLVSLLFLFLFHALLSLFNRRSPQGDV
jgi:exosortase